MAFSISPVIASASISGSPPSEATARSCSSSRTPRCNRRPSMYPLNQDSAGKSSAVNPMVVTVFFVSFSGSRMAPVSRTPSTKSSTRKFSAPHEKATWCQRPSAMKRSPSMTPTQPTSKQRRPSRMKKVFPPGIQGPSGWVCEKMDPSLVVQIQVEKVKSSSKRRSPGERNQRALPVPSKSRARPWTPRRQVTPSRSRSFSPSTTLCIFSPELSSQFQPARGAGGNVSSTTKTVFSRGAGNSSFSPLKSRTCTLLCLPNSRSRSAGREPVSRCLSCSSPVSSLLKPISPDSSSFSS